MEIEIPFGAFDSELMHQEINIPEGFEATIEGNKIILTKTESEDEQHRKWILEYLYDGLRKSDEQFKGQFKAAIAWLEKQGIFSKKDVDDSYLKGVTDTKNEIEKQYEENYQIRKDIATFIFNYRGDIKDRAKWMNYLGIKVSFVEKQDEQKPTDTCDSTINGYDSYESSIDRKEILNY